MDQPRETLRTAMRWSLVATVAAIVVCAALASNSPASLWRAYLVGYMFFWPVVLGAAGLVAIGNLTGGYWAQAARPYYLASASAVPLVAMLFIPIALNLAEIYPWAGESSAAHPLPPGKAWYLSPTFFLARAVGYIVVWLFVVGTLNYVSRPDVPPAGSPAMRRAGALSLVLLAPTVTFAAFDWAMSLEPEWYSSIYGAVVAAGGVLAAHALAICAAAASRRTNDVAPSMPLEPAHDHLTADAGIEPAPATFAAQIYNDFGNLLLAFLMVFGYFTFSQFLIIWSGNLPSEIMWFLRRLSDGWQYVALVMVALLFTAFFLLLSRERKRDPRRLAGIALVVLAAYVVHTWWTVVPAFAEFGTRWHAMCAAAIVGLGGACLTAFLWRADRNTSRFVTQHEKWSA